MSHTSIYPTVITKPELFLDVCREHGHFVTACKGGNLYGSNSVPNAVNSIKMSMWQYPIYLTSEGVIAYDNFMSQRGSMDQLGMTLQAYNEQAIMADAYSHCDNVYHNVLPDGTKELVLEFS